MIFSIKSGVADSFFGKSQEPIRCMLEREIEACEDELLTQKLFKEVESKNYAEKFTSSTAFDSFQDVGEGGSYPTTSIREGFSKVIEPHEWKNRFVVTQTMVEDEKTHVAESSGKLFAQAYVRTKEMFAASLLSNGMNRTMNFGGKLYSTTSADDVPVFSKEHPSITRSKYKQSNMFSNGIGSVAEAKESIGKISVAMSNFCDDDGNPLCLSPDTIIVPSNYTAIDSVLAAIGADKDPALQAGNGFNYMFGRWNLISSPYLNSLITADNPHPFIMADSRYNKAAYGAIWLNRIPLTVTSHIDHNNDNNVFNGRTRFSAGFNNWRAFAIGGIAEGSAA